MTINALFNNTFILVISHTPVAGYQNAKCTNPPIMNERGNIDNCNAFYLNKIFRYFNTDASFKLNGLKNISLFYNYLRHEEKL